MSASSSIAERAGAKSPPRSFSTDPDCILTGTYSELKHEIFVACVCFVLGFVALRVLRRAPSNSKKAVSRKTLPGASSEEHGEPSKPQVFTEGLAGLPHEISAEVARCLSLADFAAVSASSKATWQRFGLSPEAWHLIAADNDMEALEVKTDCKTLEGAALGKELREAFRWNLFHLHRVRHLGSLAPGIGGTGHAALFDEASTIARGLMPCDGAETIELTCLAAEHALQAHNPANEDAAAAARRFLNTVSRRTDIINATQLERLESAYSSALQLQALMDVAMDESMEDIEMLSQRSETASAAGTSPVASPTLPTVGPSDQDAVLEDLREVQRHCELDALLEKLQLQVEPRQ